MALSDEAALLSGKLSFVNGNAQNVTRETFADEKPTEQSVTRPLSETPTAPAETAEKPQDISHSGDTYPVKALKISNGNMSYDNILIRNTTDVDLDVESLLSADLPFSLEDNHEVQVLVYHTHTCERYLTEDNGEYYEDYYPRSTDGDLGVVAVGEKLVETLKEHGIGAVHDTTLHDYPSYEGSYARSWETICAYKEKYPSIKVTIDLLLASAKGEGLPFPKNIPMHDQWIGIVGECFFKVGYISEPLIEYRQHSGTATHIGNSPAGILQKIKWRLNLLKALIFSSNV